MLNLGGHTEAGTWQVLRFFLQFSVILIPQQVQAPFTTILKDYKTKFEVLAVLESQHTVVFLFLVITQNIIRNFLGFQVSRFHNKCCGKNFKFNN